MADNVDDGDVEGFEHLPTNLRQVVENIGFAVIENMPDEDREVFDTAREGNCMTCKGPLGDHANFIINKYGIVAAYCGGPCHSDMAVMGWIQEQFDDISDQIKFRGGAGDTVD